MNKYGYNRSKNESPMCFIQRICIEKDIRQEIYKPLTDCLEKILYVGEHTEQHEIKQLKSHFTQVKQALKA